MLLRPPINTHEPSSFLVHHALSGSLGRMAPVDRARKQCEPRRNPNLFLYWRSRRGLPTGHRLRPLRRGTSPRVALTKTWRRRSHQVAPGESARSRKIAPFRAVTRRGHASFRYAPLRVPPRHYLLKGPRERHTGATLARLARTGRARWRRGCGVYPLGGPE